MMPPQVAHTIMTTMWATNELWSANQPEMGGANTPPKISPTATTSPIDDAASALGTVSDGTTPMNNANDPEAAQPSISRNCNINWEPSKCSAAIGVTRPIKVKMIKPQSLCC